MTKKPEASQRARRRLPHPAANARTRADGREPLSAFTDGREQRGDRTAQRLLAAARRRFARQGYAGASVRAIARDGRANLALIRYHFGSKEALYQRVIDEAMLPLRDRLVEAFSVDGSLSRRVQRVAVAYLDYLAANRDFPKLVQRALLDEHAAIRRVGRDHLRPLFDLLRAATHLGRRRLRRIEDAVISLFGALIAPFLYAPLLQAVFDEDPLGERALERRKQHVKALVELMLGGLIETEDEKSS